MGKSLFLIIVLFTAGYAVFRPWVGSVAYYLYAILGPQYIWWWNFEGLRVSFLIALATFIGFILSSHSKSICFKGLFTPLNFWMFVLWSCVIVSYYFGADSSLYSGTTMHPKQIFWISNNIFLFYFLSCILISDAKSLRFLSFVILFTVLFMTWWANENYLLGNWSQFEQGRLMGPYSIYGDTLYKDQNNFASLFVAGLPFIFYMAFLLQSRWQRMLLWLFIPLSLHALFLTGSRGGLLSLAVVVVAGSVKNKKLGTGLLLMVVLVGFFSWQGGSIMKSRSQTLSSFEQESSAQGRLTAWKGGIKMVQAHPLTGVGLGIYRDALPEYIESNARVAHNTMIQFAAESGLMAGVAYGMVVCLFFSNSIKVERWCRQNPSHPSKNFIHRLTQSSQLSFLGYVICSMFLSLNIFEIFYYLVLINTATLNICSRNSSKTPLE